MVFYGPHVLPSPGPPRRPYLYAAVISGALSMPFVLIKTAMLQHSSLRRTQWPSHLAIYAAHAGFSIAHMVAAQRVVTWARRRYEMGLLGFGYPWEVSSGPAGSGQGMRAHWCLRAWLVPPPVGPVGGRLGLAF